MAGVYADRWPAALWLVRHGESAGNVAAAQAEAAGESVIDLAFRDMDVPLSALGEAQAGALGGWIAACADDERPTHTLASPYVRAEETARRILEASGCPPGEVTVELDERLREREFGVLDRLTPAGVAAQHPDQAAARALLGKFYHRPPGGESWADVALRLRSFIDTVSRQYAGERLLVVTHQAVILVFRYLLEGMTEAELLAVDAAHQVANCSLTTYEYDEAGGRCGGMRLCSFNDVEPVRAAGESVTREPDVSVAAR